MPKKSFETNIFIILLNLIQCRFNQPNEHFSKSKQTKMIHEYREGREWEVPDLRVGGTLINLRTNYESLGFSIQRPVKK
jgi:hypothetical protein